MKMRLFAVCLAAASALPAAGADAGISGPVGGFVLDSRTGAIRPVNGIPGASTLGAALALPFPVRQAAIAAARDFALAVSDADGAVYLLRGLAGGAPESVPLEGAPNASRIVLNASGTAALLYTKDAASLQVIAGLPDRPAVAAAFDVSGLGEIAAMALSADGARVVAGTSGEGAVYELAADGPRRLAASHGVSAIAFRNRDILFTNRTTNELVLVSGADEGGISVLAGEGNGVNQPVAVASIDAGREIWVANAGSSSVLALDMANPGVSYTLPLAAVPTRCEPFDGASVMVLNDAGEAPLLLADWARNRATYFVPADPAGAE